jgi:hypothetical protein
MFAKIHTWYENALLSIARPVNYQWQAKDGQEHHHHEHDHSADPETLAREAQSLSNEYRGLGVVLGVLGPAAVLLAITPAACELSSEHAKEACTIAECLVLFCMGMIVVHRNTHKIRQRWVLARVHAEHLRLQPLRSLCKHCDPDAGDDAVYGALRAELQKLLHEQIEYNARVAGKCEKIENVTTNITLLGFVVTICAAVAHFFVAHGELLLYVTAGLPAILGSIHSINGFLQFKHLLQESRFLHRKLQSVQAAIPPAAAGAGALPQLRLLAVETEALLAERNEFWAEAVRDMLAIPA